MKFPCLVLDHDDTVVNSTATVHFPCFAEYTAKFFPKAKRYTLEDYARAQHVLDERQHGLGVKPERLRRADARGKRGGKHVRADGDVRILALVEELVHALQNGFEVRRVQLLGEHIVNAQLLRLLEKAHGVAVLLDADGEIVIRCALGLADIRHLAEHRAGGIAHVVGAQVEVRVKVDDAELGVLAVVF